MAAPVSIARKIPSRPRKWNGRSGTVLVSLTVRVKGAQGQALEGAIVKVEKEGVEVATKVTDKDGVVNIELPAGSYSINAKYDEWYVSKMVNLNDDGVEELSVDVFIELFGVGMSMAQFLLLAMIAIALIIAVIAILLLIIIKKKPSLPPPPPP